MIGRRNPEAVLELEALQQQERQVAGEPTLTTEDFERVLRNDFEMQEIKNGLQSEGLESVIKNAVENKKAAQEKLDASFREWRLDDPTQWSRYETPAIRWGLARTCARIESVYTRHNWTLPQLPVVGTLTTGQVSAATQKTASGAPIILIDNGFFRFAGMMGQLALFARFDMRVKGYFSDATLQLISDLCSTHVCLNTCLYTYRRKTPPQYEALVGTYVEAVILFVLAHEYAHIRAGDLDAHPLEDHDGKVNLRSREFDADQLALITTVEAFAESDYGASSVFAPFIYFCGLDLLARATAAYRNVPAIVETDPAGNDYPTPFERTVSLLDWLQTTPYNQYLGEQIKDASDAYQAILFAWDRIQPIFAAAREQLAEYDSALHGAPANPDAATFAITHGLWLHIQAALGTQG